MLCLTGNESSATQLAQRLERHAEDSDLLQEVRLDALREPLDDVFGLLERFGPSLIACCRPEREGGHYVGSERERLSLLERVVRAGAAYVDVEADCADTDIARIKAAGSARLVLSIHDFTGVPADLEQRIWSMSARGADVLKAAVTVDDAIDLDRLLTLRANARRPTLLIGMGLAGLLSRCRYPAFGSPWTYVKADEQAGTAPGQLTLAQAREMGLPHTTEQPFFALVGGPQVQHSMGPVVYNRLFRATGKPWSYLPVSTSQGKATLAMLRRLGLQGASVTMPHKHVALSMGGRRADELARRVQAANSLRFDEEGAEATNTDVAGVGQPLERAFGRLSGRRPQHALVLGAGGAAKAAAVACRNLDLEVTVSAIETEVDGKLVELDAPLSGLGTRCVRWSDRHEVSADVLINATPVSGERSPWSEDVALPCAVVFDLAITGKSSRLLARARQEGAIALEAIEMWLAQGARQMSWITGEDYHVEQLREMLPAS